ncbi:MAG: hypothetical protein ACRBBW_20890 [Cellvibrionaceae bacterium]
MHVNKGRLEITTSIPDEASDSDIKNLKLFIKDFTELFNQLDDMLSLPGLFKKKAVLAKRLQKVVTLWEQGSEDSIVEYCSLAMFARDLRELADYEPQRFKEIRQKLRSQKRSSSWQGLKFEVHLAAALIRTIQAGVTIRESPDFQINIADDCAYIEATSVHLNGKTRANSHFYKVDSKITEKLKKSYANKSTALAIDITNIMYHEDLRGEGLETELEAFIGELGVRGDIDFGAIILVTFYSDFERGSHHMGHKVVPLPECNPALAEALSIAFPVSPEPHIVFDPVLPEIS